MLTATGYISADNWPSGNLLYTNPSGMRSKIIDFNPIPWDTSSDFNIEVLEVFPTGNPPRIYHTATGILLQTRSTFPVNNGNYKCRSYCGSQVRVRASGQVNIHVNYIYVDEPIHRWAGYQATETEYRGI